MSDVAELLKLAMDALDEHKMRVVMLKAELDASMEETRQLCRLEVEKEAKIATLRAALDRLIKTYDRLFDNDPRGNATLFESALANARGVLAATKGPE